MSREAELKLPIIQGALPVARQLSMDDYLKFVTFNLKHTTNRKVIRKQKKLAAVPVPFVL